MTNSNYRVTIAVKHTFDGPTINYVEHTLARTSEEARGNIAARHWNAYSFKIIALNH